MKNALVILNETPEAIASGNRLAEELGPSHAGQLLNYMLDMTVSELYPVEGAYHLYLASYSPDDDARLRARLGTTFRYLTMASGSSVSALLSTVDGLPEYNRFIFLKSNTVGIEEAAIQDWFTRMDQFDMLFGPSSGGSFFLVGFHRAMASKLANLEDWQAHHMDELDVDHQLHTYHLAVRSVAETLTGLAEIRRQVADRSGLALQIDDIIMDLTAYPDAPESDTASE